MNQKPEDPYSYYEKKELVEFIDDLMMSKYHVRKQYDQYYYKFMLRFYFAIRRGRTLSECTKIFDRPYYRLMYIKKRMVEDINRRLRVRRIEYK